jgi:hypothetical protein
MSLSTLSTALQSRTAEYIEVLAERRRLDSKYCNAIASDTAILEIFYKMYLAGFIECLSKNKGS